MTDLADKMRAAQKRAEARKINAAAQIVRSDFDYTRRVAAVRAALIGGAK